MLGELLDGTIIEVGGGGETAGHADNEARLDGGVVVDGAEVLLAAFPRDATLDAGELEVLAQEIEVLGPDGVGDAMIGGLLGGDLSDGARAVVEWGVGECVEVDCSDAVSDDGDAIGEQTGACD